MPLIFQYGSNCDTERLNSPKRLAGAADDLGRAQTIDEYELAFNVWSQGNGCAASNLMPAPGRRAWGVLYRISAAQLEALRKIEGKLYEDKPIPVRDKDGNEVTEQVKTFLVKEDARRDGLWTSADYVSHITSGLRAHGVPEDYVQHVIDLAIETNRKAAEHAADESRMIESLRRPGPSSSA